MTTRYNSRAAGHTGSIATGHAVRSLIMPVWVSGPAGEVVLQRARQVQVRDREWLETADPAS